MNRTRVVVRMALCAVAVLALVAGSASAQGTLLSVSQSDAQLRTINPATAATTGSVTMTLAGQTILGANGLATHPVSGQVFVVLRLNGVANRVLGTVNPTTGVVTQIGNMGDLFAGIAFSCAGVLYGVTGDGGNVSESLFSINQSTGAATLVGALGNGDDGEAIAFNPVDNMMYHASGLSNVIFERFDPTVTPFAITNIPIAAPLTNNEAQALTFDPISGNILWKQTFGGAGPLYSVTSTGMATTIGTIDHRSKGLTFLGGSCSSDFSITTTAPSTTVLTVRPGQSGSFTVLVSPLLAGGVFISPVSLSCTTSPFVGTCSVNPSTIPAGAGATNVTVTIAPTIFGSVPPMGGSPLLWLWVAAFATALIAVGMAGRRRVARLGYAVTLGAVMLVMSLAMFQSACAGSTGQKLQGPYQVTVTATSGNISHSTSATYNVSR